MGLLLVKGRRRDGGVDGHLDGDVCVWREGGRVTRLSDEVSLTGIKTLLIYENSIRSL